MTQWRKSETLVHQGLSWRAPYVMGQAPTLGLGGIGVEVNMGELWIEDLAYPQIVTLTLGLTSMNPALIGLGTGAIRARVIYGVGATNEEVLLDWGTQNSICLPAGKLNITAVEVGKAGLPPPNIPVPVLLTAQIAAGPRSSLGWPTLTYSFALAAGVPVFQPPPKRAKRLWVGDNRGQAASDVVVNIAANGGFAMYDLSNAADSAIRTEGIALPAACDLITFTSAAGTPLANDLIVCYLLDG